MATALAEPGAAWLMSTHLGLSPALLPVFAGLEGSSLSLTLMETKVVEETRETVSRQRETDTMAV